MDNPEPTRTNDLTLIDEPILQKLKTLMDEPNRPNERMETAEPNCEKSRTLHEFKLPKINMPITETEDPIRTKFLKLNPEPEVAKSNVLKVFPNLEHDLIDIALPINVSLRMDKPAATRAREAMEIEEPHLDAALKDKVEPIQVNENIETAPATLPCERILIVDPI
jgi:hypothetical protein